MMEGNSDDEVGRIQRWLSGAAAAIEANDASAGEASVSVKRTEVVRLLRRYEQAGVFPQRPAADGGGELMPCFIDLSQRPCALAFLLQQTGEAALAQRVACECNDALVAEMPARLTSGTWRQLSEWLETTASLSVAEAARVQPTYREDRVLSSFLAEELQAQTSALDLAAKIRARRRCTWCALL